MIAPVLPLSSYLTVAIKAPDSHRWVEGYLPASQRDIAAFRVAFHIAWHRCGGAPQCFDAWVARYQGAPAHDDALRECLEAFLGSESIGTPSAPAYQTHLDGFVAEHIWHLLLLEDAVALGTPVRVDGPDWSVTDSGGDGLAIYRIGGSLVFRLWESKAHTGDGEVKDVVNGACRQVDSHALRYLARFSKVGQSMNDPDLSAFYARLPELWRNGAPEAGGGVSVATNSSDITGCFDSFPNYWAFTHRDQRLGLVAVIDDYSAFASLVREHLWKGL